MDEPGLVFHIIAEAGNSVSIVNSFLDHLVGVFAHVKGEIIEFCESLELLTLLSIRKHIFDKLLDLFSLDDYELIERRKAVLIAEDVYLLGFSLVNKTQHNRLKKILKSKSSSKEVGPLRESQEPNINIDSAELVAACLSLQKTVKDLKKHVRELTDRVALSEGEVCVLKLSREEINSTSCSKPEVSNIAKPNSQKVVAEVHRDIDGNVQQFIKTASDNNNDIQDALSIPVHDDSVFRHSERERKNILRRRKRPPTLKVRAATEPDSHESGANSKVSTRLVYVGRLSKDTTEATIRSHLNDISVDRDDIADILKLKSKNYQESSYCISLNATEAEKTVLNNENWPTGVRVRTFHRPSVNNRSVRRNSNHQVERAPRFDRFISEQCDYRQPRYQHLGRSYYVPRDCELYDYNHRSMYRPIRRQMQLGDQYDYSVRYWR